MRTPFVAANWKMHHDRAAARAWVEAVLPVLGELRGVEVGVFPPFTLLAEVARWAEGSALRVGGQDCHAKASGAFTGDVSAAQVRDTGATHVIVGHSERRHGHGEADVVVGEKLARALAAGLTPVLCVGETLAERQAGQTLAVIRRQIEAALRLQDPAQLDGLVVAYEPVWAIGTGHNATPAQAVEVHTALRALLAESLDASRANALRIQYGGSVKAENAALLLAEPQIDGALVGGASLEPRSFLAIAGAAAAAGPRGDSLP